MSGITDFLGAGATVGNELQWVRQLITGMEFIDIAKVTTCVNNRISCKNNNKVYTDVELFVFGINGYGVKFVPAIGDRVLLIAPSSVAHSIESFNINNAIEPYDRAGIKAIPITDTKAKQLFTVSSTGIELKGTVSITLNNNTVKVTDGNKNVIALAPDGVTITDKNKNKVVLNSAGTKVTDKNNNSINMASGKLELSCGASKVSMSSSKVTIKGAAGTLEVS